MKNVSSPRRKEEKFSDLLVLHFNFSLRENCQSFEMLEGKWRDAKLGLILKDPGVRRAACAGLLLLSPKTVSFGSAWCLPAMPYDCGPNPALASRLLNPNVELYQTGKVTSTLLSGEVFLSLKEWEVPLGISLPYIVSTISISPFFFFTFLQRSRSP